jgi:hypothetical protein
VGSRGLSGGSSLVQLKKEIIEKMAQEAATGVEIPGVVAVGGKKPAIGKHTASLLSREGEASAAPDNAGNEQPGHAHRIASGRRGNDQTP